jgi:hypothetical protein
MIFALFLGLGFVTLSNTKANATIVGWDAGNIVSDAVFTNKNSMSASQIQDFLNTKVPICDTSGLLPASEFGRSDLTHAQYAALRGWPAPPYPCLREYVDGGLTAAQIIYNVSQQYQINPQVLIVLLQKEQGLVTDTWPLPTQYRSATGYGCPDTAACDSQYYGLTAQLIWSATMFRAIAYNDQNWSNPYRSGNSWYTPYLLGNNLIRYNPQVSCGETVVNIQNRSTQALYNYTPYQPNASALNAGYGVGDACGAYGNRNFYLYFTDWFTSTQIPINCVGTETPATYVRRFYNPRTYQHFYSAFDCDISFLERIGYINEGPLFNTTPSTAPWAVPIYRYFNPSTGMHIWTPTYNTPAELLSSNTGYQQEAGIVFYVVRSDMPNVTPISSFYNPQTYRHVFGPSPSQQEISDLKTRGGYDLEGTAFYTQ